MDKREKAKRWSQFWHRHPRLAWCFVYTAFFVIAPLDWALWIGRKLCGVFTDLWYMPGQLWRYRIIPDWRECGHFLKVMKEEQDNG